MLIVRSTISNSTLAIFLVVKLYYGLAFGWTFVGYGPSYTEFSDGGLTGGSKTRDSVRPSGPLVILDDLDEAQRRLSAAGTTISREISAFAGGKRFHFIDLGGYELEVWSAQK